MIRRRGYCICAHRKKSHGMRGQMRHEGGCLRCSCSLYRKSLASPNRPKPHKPRLLKLKERVEKLDRSFAESYVKLVTLVKTMERLRRRRNGAQRALDAEQLKYRPEDAPVRRFNLSGGGR